MQFYGQPAALLQYLLTGGPLTMTEFFASGVTKRNTEITWVKLAGDAPYLKEGQNFPGNERLNALIPKR